MPRLPVNEEIYSALYVDFDSIYSGFQESDPEAARVFATTPYRWVRWLENHALRILYGDGVKRRILKRVCYLNPLRYQEFRNPFTRSAFQAIDCLPASARSGSTTALHLVMDCMDDLNHNPPLDEFIILSGETEFTPLLLRLQEYAKRSLVLAAGHVSPAYTAAASWRIREDWFIQQALKDERAEDEEEQLAARPVRYMPLRRTMDDFDSIEDEDDEESGGNR